MIDRSPGSVHVRPQESKRKNFLCGLNSWGIAAAAAAAAEMRAGQDTVSARTAIAREAIRARANLSAAKGLDLEPQSLLDSQSHRRVNAVCCYNLAAAAEN